MFLSCAHSLRGWLASFVPRPTVQIAEGGAPTDQGQLRKTLRDRAMRVPAQNCSESKGAPTVIGVRAGVRRGRRSDQSASIAGGGGGGPNDTGSESRRGSLVPCQQ